MNKTIKRGLAIAAIAPLAIIGTAGVAAADTGNDNSYNTDGTGNFAFLCNTPFGNDTWFSVAVQRADTGENGWAHDVDNVLVEAPDNGGKGTYLYDSQARVEKITVEYQDEDGDTIDTEWSKKRARKDGSVHLEGEEGVESIVVKVRWSSFHNQASEVLKCYSNDLDSIPR